MIEPSPSSLPAPTPAAAAAHAATKSAVSPSAIVLAGVGVGGSLIIGLPAVAAVVVGAGFWGIRVGVGALLAASRRRKALRPEPIDPFAVPEPWRQYERQSVTAQTKFNQTVTQSQPGPFQDRLQEIARRIEDGVRECWRVAHMGAGLDASLAGLDREGTSQELRRTQEERRQLQEGSPSATALDQTEAALAARLQSTVRIEAARQRAADRLRVLTAQLNEAVASAVELSLDSTDPSAASPLAGHVDHVVGDIEALRQAMEEAQGTPSA
ncbi:MAG TPA: hypothetical protein VLL25_08785 [Acidimicrobiales bacterium]|nr:hypothetical protein [Acidimicrobiales bacterium]